MRRFIALLLGVAAVVAAPLPSHALQMTIDEIIVQGGGDSSVLSGTASFTLSGSTLTIVLTNTSSGATGGTSATNLLTGIGFNLPTGVTIANNAGVNTVAGTAVGGTLTDSTWGAGNNPQSAINNITTGGDVNASAATLQAFIDFDLAGVVKPPANVDGPGFGILSANVSDAGGLQYLNGSATITLALAGGVPGNLLDQINNGWLVLTFGSPTVSTVPEPPSLVLVGTVLAGLAVVAIRKRSVKALPIAS
jgi:hypothetical protein